ncbi:MAG TPA: hypothetical protein VIB82_08160 [Caulobacteraceae bacterium]|jgi:hypothetical protein
MSILSQLAEGKISFSQAASEAEAWFAKLVANAPAPVQADIKLVETNFKQVASDALGLADTAMGPILSVATVSVEAAANTALTAAGVIALCPAADAAISNIEAALKAQVDATVAQWRANLTPAAMAPVPNPAA